MAADADATVAEGDVIVATEFTNGSLGKVGRTIKNHIDLPKKSIVLTYKCRSSCFIINM
jgi:hypothetical protein